MLCRVPGGCAAAATVEALNQMKTVSLLAGLLALTIAWGVAAQPNPPPVRLAIVPEDASSALAADMLTAALSQQENLQLLERADIEKVYREQSLSATGQDSLKLGRILGADGVLALRAIASPDSTNLMVQLIAVKPGVILFAPSFALPLAASGDWASAFAPRLHAYWPKLSVLAKDAIPLSVVNLRSAIQSPEGIEAEKQLKLLAIQRLSQEPRFFVLDRERIQSLGEEKERNADESAFWDGSYLLEGVLDQNGYAKDTLTLNARLTPAKGGAPLLLEVSGSRTNYAEVISRLAAKITELLRVNSTLREWNPADEAQQYFEEAKWALKWGVLAEAQSAADSAWALGKRDVDCAARHGESRSGSRMCLRCGAITLSEIGLSRATNWHMRLAMDQTSMHAKQPGAVSGKRHRKIASPSIEA